jgi:hypothetical protein
LGYFGVSKCDSEATLEEWERLFVGCTASQTIIA